MEAQNKEQMVFFQNKKEMDNIDEFIPWVKIDE